MLLRIRSALHSGVDTPVLAPDVRWRRVSGRGASEAVFASESFLYIEVTLTGQDLRYGYGMPLDTPASIRPAALDAMRTWIDRGAAR